MTATIAAVLLSAAASAGAASAAPATPENVQAWHRKLEHAPQASAAGCFTARYPRVAWTKAECVAPPAAPMKPRPSGPVADSGPGIMRVGARDHLVAESPQGAIYRATGTFEEVNVSTVESPIVENGPAVFGAYTLQLNTNFFTTTGCAGSPNAKCQGWQQFVFANNGTTGAVYIEYWLRDYDADCPADGTAWTQLDYGGGSIYCYHKTPATGIASNTPISGMRDFQLIGDNSVAGAKVVFSPDAGATTYRYTAPTKVLDPGAGWKQAEFNLFGYGHDAMAVFNPGATARVRTTIEYSGPDPAKAPKCREAGFTGESNNLYVVDMESDPPNTPAPALIFQQADGSLDASCARAITVGDTHQHTFAGLLYDFQASGDFVEAQVGTGFEVQTRKVSGAPDWPNASLNRSVGVRMGSTAVTVCDGTRLLVNGAAVSMPPSGSLTLPSGVNIQRTGNVHAVRDPAGNSVRVELRGRYIDLHVGLGEWPVPVRGLMGNHNNNPYVLEGRDGTPYPVPISFVNLYQRFGASWRVPPAASLLAPCGTVVAGNPTWPFFAADLPSSLRYWAESGCRQAGVATPWMEPCTLDVAVFGSTAAAAVYVGRKAPRVNAGRPTGCSMAGGCR